MFRTVFLFSFLILFVTTLESTLLADFAKLRIGSFKSARSVWSNCRGKRLDKLVLYKHMTANECIEMGGNCCGINIDGIMNGSDDPKVMLPNDKCYTCYNSTIKVKCTGGLVRSQTGFYQEWWVNSKNCIRAGGLCCNGRSTPSNPSVFDPNEYPYADFCLNCYSGPMSNETDSCSGELLANNDYSARTCSFFGGNCCDDDPYIGGNAFRASSFPDAKCYNCYKGEAKEVDDPAS